jgi:hypothetical protein
VVVMTVVVPLMPPPVTAVAGDLVTRDSTDAGADHRANGTAHDSAGHGAGRRARNDALMGRRRGACSAQHQNGCGGRQNSLCHLRSLKPPPVCSGQA